MATDAELSERRSRLLGPTAGLPDGDLKAHVRTSYAQLTAAFQALSPVQATWKPDAAEWSAAQICDHMVLSTGVLGNITSLLAKG